MSVEGVAAVLTASKYTTAEILREEVRNILEPSLKKLSSLDAERISRVVEDCIRRMEMVAMLPAVLAHLDSLSNKLGKELTGALMTYKRLGERVETLQQGPSEVEKSNELSQSNVAHIEKAFQNSLRDVLRLFRDNPAVTDLLKTEVDVGCWESKDVQCLIGGLRDLHRVLLERLLTTPEEEQEQSRYMQKLSSSHDSNMEMISSLETDLQGLIKRRKAKISEKTDVINEMENSLKEMGKTVEEQTNANLSRQKEEEKYVRILEVKKTRIQQDIDQLTDELYELQVKHKKDEKVLFLKNCNVESDINTNRLQHNDCMEKKKAVLAEIMLAYEMEQQKLQKMKEAYAPLKIQYDQIQQERQLEEDRMEEERRELKKKGSAVIVIQAGWRGYTVRKAMKDKNKSKKGKDKKGKDKKGKDKKGK